MKRPLLALGTVALLLAGCTAPSPPVNSTPAVASGSPVATAIPTPAFTPTPYTTGPAYQALLEQAKQGNGHLKAALGNVSPEAIRTMQERFQRETGIPLVLENVPGNPSREIPVRVLQAQQAGQDVVDWIEGGTAADFTPIMQAGGLQTPPWDALKERFPLIDQLRQLYPAVPGGPNGTSLNDYCMLQTQAAWVVAYNPRTVKAQDVQGLKWDDLLTGTWKNRVAVDATGLGLRELAFGQGWSVARLTAYATNLGANGAKLVEGGSAGVLQAVVQGVSDVGVVSADQVAAQLGQKNAAQVAWPDVVPLDSLGICLPKTGTGNAALAQIFFAWRAFDGQYVQTELGGGNARPLFAPEADRFPVARLAQTAGITPDRVAEPKTPDDFAKLEAARQAVVTALKAGQRSGQSVPYPPAQPE